MALKDDYLGEAEVHSPEGIRAVLQAGVSAIEPINGQSPLECLIEGYLRSSRFAECIEVLMEAGATFDDPVLAPLLLDDPAGLMHVLERDNRKIDGQLSLPCAFTNCAKVTLLHICAEFNCVECARVLLNAGANVNAAAGMDEQGFGGQTPLFHCVNSIFNYSRPVMELLVQAGADLDIRLKGLIWGRNQPWETTVLDVSPLSYAQCGLYRQFHRSEQDIFNNLAYLYRHKYGAELHVKNVPNKYMNPG